MGSPREKRGPFCPKQHLRLMQAMSALGSKNKLNIWRYVGSRLIKLRKSQWRDRNLDVIQKKVAEKQLLGLK
ncbi:hypothetical protein HAZT_HAZT005487 [Hyalella azteca]|uniref:Uncharacterized protein n=1 Tax=Hyalella azteca TaxID=294128 RepID=A0A6A0GWD4_HYAAZ|nr:hypothetical protein HAZT_HAZT005487 [Hyalella azteca]